MKYLSLRRAAAAATLLVSLAAPSAFAQLWTFDSGSEGWMVADYQGEGDYFSLLSTSPVTYHATGGRSGGYISATDPSTGSFFFQGPSGTLGDFASYIGGTLSFSLKTDDVTDYTADSVVLFRGAGYTIVTALGAQPGADWTDYNLTLSASNFRFGNLGGTTVSEDDFNSILSNLTGFEIVGEFHAGVTETTGLDAVAFSSPVPEPSTYGLIGSVALIAGVALRRRKKSAQV